MLLVTRDNHVGLGGQGALQDLLVPWIGSSAAGALGRKNEDCRVGQCFGPLNTGMMRVRPL